MRDKEKDVTEGLLEQIRKRAPNIHALSRAQRVNPYSGWQLTEPIDDETDEEFTTWLRQQRRRS